MPVGRSASSRFICAQTLAEADHVTALVHAATAMPTATALYPHARRRRLDETAPHVGDVAEPIAAPAMIGVAHAVDGLQVARQAQADAVARRPKKPAGAIAFWRASESAMTCAVSPCRSELGVGDLDVDALVPNADQVDLLHVIDGAQLARDIVKRRRHSPASKPSPVSA